jgi:hypothetical protein
MSHITADEIMLARLREIAVPVEIRDESGKVLGLYTPARSPEEEALYERALQIIDLDQAKRVAATERGMGRTTEDVLRRLQGKGTGPAE